jgi:hypothetical protein
MLGTDFCYQHGFRSPCQVCNHIGVEVQPTGKTPRRPYNHWEPFHREQFPSPERLANWELLIPCGTCKENYRRIKADNPPRFGDWFTWTWEIHNSVNVELSRCTVSLADAVRTWRPPSEPGKTVDGCKIVTAFSPKRLSRQKHCLDSWLRSGFEVVALQTRTELASMKSEFQGVSWIEENAVTDCYDFSTQRIQRLLSESTDEPVLLLNSDIELCGGGGLESFLDDLSRGTPKFYLRWNYSGVQVAREFEFGLDGLLLWPQDAKAIPVDAPYGIGQAMWDYAVPYFLKEHGRGYSIAHYPWLMHEEHSQNWSNESWETGFDWLLKQGYQVDYDQFRNGEYRRSIDPGFNYSGADGMWVSPCTEIAPKPS